MNRRAMIVGVGGGGCKVLDRIAGLTPEGLPLVAVDTDSRALLDCRATTKLDLGAGPSGGLGGLGTGGEPTQGRLAAEEEVQQLRSVFSGLDVVILVGGLGGGTGTGAMPVVLNAARDAGAATLCFATLPFSFEGDRRQAQAEKAVPFVREATQGLVLLSNDMLLEFVGESGVAEAYNRVAEVLGAGIYAIWRLIVEPEYVNVDFADFQKMLRSGGTPFGFGYGSAMGDGKAEAAMDRLLGGPLLEKGEALGRAHAVLISLMGGKDLTVPEVRQVKNAVSSRVGKDCHVMMGTVVDDAWQGQISVAVVTSEYWGAPSTAAPAFGSAAPAARVEAGKKSKSGQTQLTFDAAGKGRFKDAVPTVLDGEDLDVPTFIRRQIRIER